MQYDFFINILRKRKRFSKWQKYESDDVVSAVKEYYNYSEEKALDVMSILTEEQISIIIRKVSKGGRK